jgi:DNA-binding PadR family transcriptional regulator
MRHFFDKLRERHAHYHECRDEMMLHMIGRRGHGHGRGFGRFGGGDDETGGRDFRAGRKLSSGDLQLIILSLLEEKPCHGYEVIKALEERTNGFYAPSPGMVYPALTYLEEVGQASVVQEGNKKQYNITDEGRAWLNENRDRVEAILSRLTAIGDKMDRIREVFGEKLDRHASRFGMSVEDDGGRFVKELNQARNALKAAIRSHAGAGEDEQRRIAAILAEAARQIEAGGK